jgi:hypothetical protein
MKFSSREAVLTLTTASVVLFGGTAMLSRSRIEEWKELRQKQTEVQAQIAEDQQLVAEKDKWLSQFAALRQIVPHYPADMNMDIHWLSVMDNIASRHNVNISKRQVGEEKKVGDLYELPVECREWEGTLEAMVHFLFDLQNESAMLDVRQLLVKPKDRDLLRGRFVLFCAYTRAP